MNTNKNRNLLQQPYDFIVCGAGCAGLTFIYKILPYAKLKNKKILLIDSNTKKENDRTWCFWNDVETCFDPIIEKKWDKLQFKTNNYNFTLNIWPYQYKLIKGINFYDFCFKQIKQENNVDFVEANIEAIENSKTGVVVTTKENSYLGKFALNSILFNPQKLITPNSLLQHFKGWVIKTTDNFFNDNVATFMDFSISQNAGASFMYVLPTSSNTALVEYTLFTKQILATEEYDAALKKYIKENLGITSYSIIHIEFGIIPMTDYKFQKHNGNIINMGIASGCVKPSTGFAFNFIQQEIDEIINLIAADKPPFIKTNFKQRKFRFYDSVLLEVINQNKMPAHQIFELIFKKNPPQRVLQFLNNKTNIWQDLLIMNSVPTKIFLPVALKKLLHIK